MTPGQHIDYDALAREALRGVVKACLAQVSRTGLVGDHHFYIAFNTQAPGVGMSKRLKEKYPVEMTIVLQHRFWDLAVDDERFEVKLTFDGIPERLVVPFAAIRVFYDPSVPYGVQFEENEAGTGDGTRRTPARPGMPHETSPTQAAADAIATSEAGPDRRRPLRRTRPERTPDGRRIDDDQAEAPTEDATTAEPSSRPHVAEKPQPVAPKPAIVAVAKADAPAKDDAGDDGDKGDAGGAKIFDLSKFRGKK